MKGACRVTDQAIRPGAWRLPLVPTVIVAAAVATMIALGLWQIDRAGEKAEMRALFERNATLPVMVDRLPDGTAERRTMLFRTVDVDCPAVSGWDTGAARDAQGNSGWRHIAVCGVADGAPPLLADVGTGSAPRFTPAWRGGRVRGTLIEEPDRHGLIERLSGNLPLPRLMVVADTAADGLVATARPDPANLTDNHMAYAVQWFLFALAALVIYALALRRRMRALADADPRR